MANEQEFTEFDDAIMPDLETLTVAEPEKKELKGPQPDTSEHSEPTNEPGQEPADAEEPEKTRTPKGKAKDAADDDAADGREPWDKDRQRQDEQDARRGESKAELRERLAQTEARLAALEGKAAGATREPEPEADEPGGKGKAAMPELPKWEDLPETDDYDGRELPHNKQMNAFAKQMLARDEAREAEMKELRGTVDAREEAATQAENRDAYRTMLRTIAPDPAVRQEVDKRLHAVWEKRGYNDDYYPDYDQTEDIMGRIAERVENERLRKELAEARKRGYRTAQDTGKGGRRPSPNRAASVIEPNFERAAAQQIRRGDFRDVQG